MWGLDEQNLSKGATADINPLLRELGLHELDFPPPPRRARPQESDEPDDDDDADRFDDDEYEAAAAGPMLPPLPAGRPLTMEEAEFRLSAAMDAFDMAGDALDVMADSGSTLIDDLLAITDGLIDETDFNYVVRFVIPIWFALVPGNSPAPQLTRESLRRALVRDLESIASPTALKSGPDHLLQKSRQPELTLCVMGNCMEGFSRMPKGIRPKPEAQAVISLVLCTVINELDRAIRG